MNSAAKSLHRQPVAQVLLAVLTSAIFWWYSGTAGAQAALFGGVIAVINSLIQLWHLHRANKTAGCSVSRNMRILYRCAAERLVLTTALFALGLGILKLQPLPLITGFIVALGAIFLEGAKTRQYGQ